MISPISREVLRVLLVSLGVTATVLGVLGIFLPVVPTVPLLLLAAACFARSSETFYRWLMEHPRLGLIVRSYRSGEGIPLRAKATAIAMLWVTIPISAWFAGRGWVRLLLFTLAATITVYLLRLPTPAAVTPKEVGKGPG